MYINNYPKRFKHRAAHLYPHTYSPVKTVLSGLGITTGEKVAIALGITSIVAATLYSLVQAKQAEAAKQEALGQAIAAQAELEQDKGRQQELLGQSIAAQAQANYLKSQVADLTAKYNAAQTAAKAVPSSPEVYGPPTPSNIEAAAKAAAYSAGSKPGLPLQVHLSTLTSNPAFLFMGGLVVVGAIGLSMMKKRR